MRFRLLFILLLLTVIGGIAHAQQAKGFLVPPAGGSYEIAVHPAFVTALSPMSRSSQCEEGRRH